MPHENELIEFLRHAAYQFSAAGISWQASRVGILGIWIGPPSCTIPADTATQLGNIDNWAIKRTMESSLKWNEHRPGERNPYEYVLKYLVAGGEFIRWENNILDVVLPDGTRYGLPESFFQPQRG